jgi:DNA-binding MarR family transcriptional regulator
MRLDKDMPTAPFISIIYREHAKYINEIVKKDGLSYGLHPLLVKIYKNEGTSQEQLASAFHLNESTITRNLKR